jgi:hypothetical protein
VSQPYRDDLLLAAYAIALGFEILGGRHAEKLCCDHFNDTTGIPADSLSFERTTPDGNGVVVWQTDRGWRVARLLPTGYEKPTPESFHPKLKDALDAAKTL